MNPTTNKFEELQEKDHSVLVRPNGEPVPKSWTIFTVGELVTIKDYTFKVAHIGESYIIFEPVKTDDLFIKVR